MLQPDVHDAPHEDREAPFGNALLLGGSTGWLSQAALRVPTQGPEAERWSTVATSGHYEQHDTPGTTGNLGCHGYDCRHDSSAAYDLSGRRPRLQLRGPAASHHLKGSPSPPLVIWMILSQPTNPRIIVSAGGALLLARTLVVAAPS